MSLKLLDLAVEGASEGLPEEHFLRQEDNISAVRNMIMGVTDGVAPEKTWLYTIVNNRQSGAQPYSRVHPMPFQHNSVQQSDPYPTLNVHKSLFTLWAKLRAGLRWRRDHCCCHRICMMSPCQVTLIITQAACVIQRAWDLCKAMLTTQT